MIQVRTASGIKPRSRHVLEGVDIFPQNADLKTKADALKDVRRKYPVSPLPVIAGYSEILALWGRKAKDGRLPMRSDFTFEDFTGWHGSIAISMVDGDDLRFTLYGSGFVELLGVDLTNCDLFSSIAESSAAETRSHFAELARGPFIGRTSGSVPTPNREFVPFDVLDLPLSDDGRTVNRFLHALYRAT